MTRAKATAIGFTAILMWALLALLTIQSSPVPPLLLNAICFGLGGIIGLIWTARKGFSILRAVSWKVYAFGTIGLFGYHFLYFTAFRISPSAETGLIAYLWPLFIVLVSGLLPGEKLTAQHIIGALLAFAGAALIILAKDSSGAGNALGFLLAFACAITWTAYSVLSRRMGDVPTEAVTVFCLATALLSAAAHLSFEETVWPAGTTGWLAVLLLGIGPVGAAFFTWDIGMKKGDIQLLGVASYAAPLLSTLVLVAAGISAASWSILLAALLIAGGAAIAARKARA
ncbi:DMT family transporter [Xinfangfangia sp. CPCC 101601]|uniref:DMT family transporter n=1 Tax=Pseudogemmobacter lacusdianii TaxID=3069608 RepID=A0ABU0VX26_9RHOB|nr:DMT family transporter [Xinfangfangia sp. CPCC 101601]MDQ2066297.1 DMT family transporter [Xinfangfangia sp. CPCC 101601]